MDRETSAIRATLSEASEVCARYLSDVRSAACDGAAAQSRLTDAELRIARAGCGPEALGGLLERYLACMPRTDSVGFANQLSGGVTLGGVVGEMASAVASTTMATREAAPAATEIELELVRHVVQLAGMPSHSEGVATSGGTQSNLVAMLCARSRAVPDAKEEGLWGGPRLVAFVSDQAHYSFASAANQLGLGTKHLRCVKSDAAGRMIPEELEAAIASSEQAGETPFFVAATAGTTVMGAFDPIREILAVCKRHPSVWLHVDGAWGGPVILSRKHKHMIDGVQKADSFSIDMHKLLSVPLTCSIFVTSHQQQLRTACSAGNRTYLFHTDDDDCVDLGERSLACGRRSDCVKAWMSWKSLGDEGYEEAIDRLMDLAQRMPHMVSAHPRLEMLHTPEFLNVCFRYAPRDGRTRDLNRLNLEVRSRLLARGRWVVNYAHMGPTTCIRFVLTNFRLAESDVESLVQTIEEIGDELVAAESGLPCDNGYAYQCAESYGSLADVTPLACIVKCSETQRCTAWKWTPTNESMGSCLLSCRQGLVSSPGSCGGVIECAAGTELLDNADMSGMPVSTTEGPDGCARLCRLSSECTGYTADAAAGTCTLKKGNPGSTSSRDGLCSGFVRCSTALGIASSALSRQNCTLITSYTHRKARDSSGTPSQCVSTMLCTPGLAAGSGSVHIGDDIGADDWECARACSLVPNCTAYSVMAGSTQDLTTPSCRMWTGSVSLVSDATSTTQGCQGYTMDYARSARAQQCWLKKKMTLSPLPTTADARQGRNLCSARFKCTPMSGFTGNPLSTVTRAYGGDDYCMSLCMTTSGCVSYVVASNPDTLVPNCTLYAAGASSVYWVSSCAGTLQCRATSGISGQVISTSVTQTDEDCGQLCRNSDGCVGWTVSPVAPFQYRCTLLRSVSGNASAPSACFATLQCAPRTSIVGDNIESVTTTGDFECSALCHRRKGCVGFSYIDGSSPNCYLKSSASSVKRNIASSCSRVLKCKSASAIKDGVYTTVNVDDEDDQERDNLLVGELCFGDGCSPIEVGKQVTAKLEVSAARRSDHESRPIASSMSSDQLFVVCGSTRIAVPFTLQSKVTDSIDVRDIARGKLLGTGSFSTVYQARWKDQEVAIKSYPPQVFMDEDLYCGIVQETEICTHLRNPYIVLFYGTAVSKDCFYLVMEFVKHGSLGGLIQQQKLSQSFKLRCALDVAKGMNFLHQNNIIHRDLKTDNVLISSLDERSPVIAKISDFNTSRFIGSEAYKTKTKGVGTPAYMAPEILDGKNYSQMADVFSYGIVLWSLYTQKKPYEDLRSHFAVLNFVTTGKREPIPQDAPPLVQRLIDKSWAQNPDTRPSFSVLAQELEAMNPRGPRLPRCPGVRPRGVRRTELEARAFLQKEYELKEWIWQCLGVRIAGVKDLTDGVILCRLAEAVKPGSVGNFAMKPANMFARLDNVSKFLQAVRKHGVPDGALFTAQDLAHEKNLPLVVVCMAVIGWHMSRSCAKFGQWPSSVGKVFSAEKTHEAMLLLRNPKPRTPEHPDPEPSTSPEPDPVEQLESELQEHKRMLSDTKQQVATLAEQNSALHTGIQMAAGQLAVLGEERQTELVSKEQWQTENPVLHRAMIMGESLHAKYSESRVFSLLLMVACLLFLPASVLVLCATMVRASLRGPRKTH
eukprot:m51a1_g4594 putative C-tail anchored protein (1658) ;mRNA; r:197434-205668